MAGQVVVEMSGDEAKLFRSVQRMVAAQTKMEQKWKDVGRAGAAAGDKTGRAVDRLGQKSKKAFDPRQLRNLVTGLIGGAGVLGALNRINAAYTVWLRNQREISAAATTGAGDIVSFLALQPAGTGGQRLKTVRAIAESFGIGKGAPGTVQALQSIRGAFGPGLEAAKAVFAGTQVEIPLEQGTELEIFGAGVGAKPGQTIRQAFAAGQVSGRDPLALAGAAPSLQFFETPLEAFGFGSVLTSAVKPKQLNEFLRTTGLELSGVGKLAEPGPRPARDPRDPDRPRPPGPSLFERLGVLDASRLERLEALNKAGLDTAEKLKAAGLIDRTALLALGALVSRAGEVRSNIEKIRAAAVPGVLIEARRKAEAEEPTLRAVPLGQAFQAIAQAQKAFGPATIPAQSALLRERARAMALRASGFEQAFGIDLIRPDDTAGPLATVLASVRFGPGTGGTDPGGGGPGNPFSEFLNRMDRINNVLSLFERGLLDSTRAAEITSRIVTGGDAMMPPDADR